MTIASFYGTKACLYDAYIEIAKEYGMYDEENGMRGMPTKEFIRSTFWSGCQWSRYLGCMLNGDHIVATIAWYRPEKDMGPSGWESEEPRIVIWTHGTSYHWVRGHREYDAIPEDHLVLMRRAYGDEIVDRFLHDDLLDGFDWDRFEQMRKTDPYRRKPPADLCRA